MTEKSEGDEQAAQKARRNLRKQVNKRRDVREDALNRRDREKRPFRMPRTWGTDDYYD